MTESSSKLWKVVNSLGSGQQDVEKRNFLLFWPYNFFCGMSAIKPWRSFLMYSTRLFSYPLQIVNYAVTPLSSLNGLPEYDCPIESSLHLTRYRNYPADV